MPSILTQYENVDFLAGRPFTYLGTAYKQGEAVPEAKTFNNLETLVRSRYLIPVVDDYSKHAPLQFRHEVKPRELALRKLGIDSGKEHLEDDQPVPTPLTVPEDESNEFNPADHTIEEVLDFVDEYPDELLSVYAQEEEGKARSTLLKKLDDRLNEQVDNQEGGSDV